MTINDLLSLAGQFGAGVTFLLLLALYGAFKGHWYTGIAYRALEARHAKEIESKDQQIREWRALALHSTDLVGAAVEVAKQ